MKNRVPEHGTFDLSVYGAHVRRCLAFLTPRGSFEMDNRIKKAKALIAAGVSLAIAGAAASTPITIANHSFEQDDVSGLNNQANGNIVPTGWSEYDDGRNDATAGNARGLVYHGPGPSAYADTLGQNDGSQSFFTAQRDILQVLGETLEANTTYTLTVAIGDRAPIPIYTTASTPGTPEVNLGYGSTGGENILLTLEASNQPAQVDGGWVEWSGTFTTGAAPAGVGQALRIELTNGTNVGWFDNVRLDASPVPEPGSLALLGLGGLALLRRRRA